MKLKAVFPAILILILLYPSVAGAQAIGGAAGSSGLTGPTENSSYFQNSGSGSQSTNNISNPASPDILRSEIASPLTVDSPAAPATSAITNTTDNTWVYLAFLAVIFLLSGIVFFSLINRQKFLINSEKISTESQETVETAAVTETVEKPKKSRKKKANNKPKAKRRKKHR